MKRPRLLVWGLVWVSVVVAACGVTWAVIDSVGAGILGGTEPQQLPVAGSTPSGDPSREPTASTRPRRTRAPGPTPTSSPPTTSAGPSATASVVRSWSGRAGVVTVRCDGGAASLESASPNDGWGMELDKQGPDEVRVEFETGGEDEQRTRVRVECGLDGPVFEVDADD